MPGNLFKSAWRNIRKGRIFSVINIFGLAIGLSVCLLIALFVTDEFSYDKYNEKADRIFRITSDVHINGNSLHSVNSPAPMGPAMVRDFPRIENMVRIRSEGEMLVWKGNEKELESNIVKADPNLFAVFTLPMVAGDPHTALAEPNSLVISESMANKYFNNGEAMGKTITMEEYTVVSTYKITGIIKDMPAASHFHFHFIKSLVDRDEDNPMQWINFFGATYLLAKPGETQKDIDNKLQTCVEKYIDPPLKENLHSSLADLAKHGDYFRFYSTPLTRIHLYSNNTDEFETNGSMLSASIFIVIAIFILLLACVNFVNLSTARSADRSREVGVRKVLGSSRWQLIAGFLGESFLTTLMALLLSLVMTTLLLTSFNRLSGKDFHMTAAGVWQVLRVFLFCPLIIGLLAGSYPAFYLSAFKPIQTLRGRLVSGSKGGWLRSGLVVFQFVTAISLIIGTFVIYSQLHYIRNRDLGFNRFQVLTVENIGNLGDQAKIFEGEVRELPGIAGSTMTGSLPNKRHGAQRGYFLDGSARATQTISLSSWPIDSHYIPLLDMKIITGRNFSPTMQTDSLAVLINETAAHLLGYPDPVGKFIYTGPSPVVAYRILGVVKDFNAGTLHEKIEPIVFHLRDDRQAVSFKISTADIPGLIAKIRDRYRSLGKAAGHPFVYSFMDDNFNKLYESDRRTGNLFVSFALLAIFIACLGLFGLVTYAAEQRTKEIGIRKVLGATVSHIVGLLSMDFLKLVMVAAVIAGPIAWWGMHRWLQDFAYRTVIGWWVFLIAGALAMLITILTVSFRAMRAAMANPVRALRSE